MSQVIHAAGQIDVNSSMQKPKDDAIVNVIGTINILECCVYAKVKEFIFSSTAAVYGDPQYIPIDEDHPKVPDSPNGISKYSAEHYVRVYGKDYDLNYLIFRYSNVYGPRQRSGGEGGVVPSFINQILEKKRPIIYGDGLQTRDFIFVDDVSKAHLSALELMEKKKVNSETLNLSCNTQHSINEIVLILNELFNTSMKPHYKEKRYGDIRHSRLDNTGLIKKLMYSPQIDFRKGLEKTIRYCKDTIKN